MNENNYLQYKKEQGVFSHVFQSKNFENVGISRTSQANGDNTGYYVFTIRFSTVINMNEYVKITPPEAIVVTPESN